MLERQTLTPEEEWDRYHGPALRHVHNGRVRWREGVGFEWADGRRFGTGRDGVEELRLLITLWKARDKDLLRVDGAVVLLTARGRAT